MKYKIFLKKLPKWLRNSFLNEKIMLDNKSPEKIYIDSLVTQSLIIVNSEKLLMKKIFMTKINSRRLQDYSQVKS